MCAMNDDFVFFRFWKQPKGGRQAKEYAISLDMAKELAMVGAWAMLLIWIIF